MQENIINYIKREDNLFLVGDVKQSIYRFRLADPSLFLDKQCSYGCEDGDRDRRIDLKTNFRSHDAIIKGVNYVFRHIMSPDLGEIAYDARAELNPGVESGVVADAGIELCLVERKQDLLEGQEDEGPVDHIQIEAELVAKRIKGLLEESIWDARQGCSRQPNYRDIVILLRATRRADPDLLRNPNGTGHSGLC